MTILVQFLPEALAFRLFSADDHATPVGGVTPTVTVSRAGVGFAASAGATVERSDGWWELRLAPGDVASPGPLILHAEAPGCDASDLLAWVVASPGLAPLTVGVPAPIPFLMESPDDASGVPGLAPAATVTWPGGTTATGAAAEIGHGWYAPTLTPPQAGTATLAATATGAASAGVTLEVGPASGGLSTGTIGDPVVTLTVTRTTAAGRLGVAVPLKDAGTLWAYYDGANDSHALALVSGTGTAGATVLRERIRAGIPVGGSTALTVFVSGRQAVLAADGRIRVAAVAGPVDPDGVASALQGEPGLAGADLAGHQPAYDPGEADRVARWVVEILAASGVTAPSGSDVAMDPEPFPYAGLPMVLVRPGSQRADEPLVAGTGRTYDPNLLEFALTVVARNAADMAARDTLALGRPGGLTSISRYIFDILQLTWPRTAAGAYLTREPMRLAGAQGPARTYRKCREWRALDLAARVPLALPSPDLD